MGLQKSSEYCQPCDNFTLDEDDMAAHWCPECDGKRYFCVNCNKDHHVGGWNSCAVTPLMRTCRHPKCKEKSAATPVQEQK